MKTRPHHKKEETLTKEDSAILDFLWRKNQTLYEALEESIFQCYFRFAQ